MLFVSFGRELSSSFGLSNRSFWFRFWFIDARNQISSFLRYSC